MPGYTRPAGGWHYDFKGLKTNAAPDELPPDKYPYVQNVRAVHSLQTRPGYVPVFFIKGAVDITTTCPLPTATQKQAYSQAFAATGGTGPYTWTLFAGSFPTGITMNSAGLVSGTPTGYGVSSFTVQATDSIGTVARKSCQMTVTQQSLNFTDNFNIPDTSGPPYTNLGVKWSVTVDAPGLNANGVEIQTHAAGFFYVSGDGSGYVGAFTNFVTYAVSGAAHPLLGSADQLSEGTLIADSSTPTNITRGGPAVMMAGSAVAKSLSGYVAVYKASVAGFQLLRINTTTQTNLGSPIAGVVGDRITITAEDTGALTRIKVYNNTVLLQTYDDSSGSRLTSGSMGFLVFFCSSGVGARWDDWTCATPV